MKRLIIFGTGVVSEAVSYYFERDSNYSIAAYVCDRDFIRSETFMGKPVIPTESLTQKYPPAEYTVFAAMGYQGMNSIRTEKVEYLRRQGYSFASYISPRVQGKFTIGENSIVMDDAIIQPCVKIGNNVFVWGGAMIGHHADIGDNCWLTGSCAVGGLVKLGKNCFLGLNTTIGNEITIGDHCMLGAGTLCCGNLPTGAVLVAQNTPTHRLDSEQFCRLSRCFRA